MGKTTFDVTYVSEGNVTNIPETLAVLYKDQITVSDLTPVRDGYTFIGWKLYSNVVIGGNRLIIPFSDVTLAAVLEKKYFNITFESEGTVANIRENVLAEYDTQHIVSNVVPEDEGYTFIGWKLWDTLLDKELN